MFYACCKTDHGRVAHVWSQQRGAPLSNEARGQVSQETEPSYSSSAGKLALNMWSLLLLLGTVPLASGHDLSSNNTDGVCQSVDVRSLDAFERLQGCRVVEGYVQIVLIDQATEDSFANLSFPELREITHYLFLYRVNGLRYLGKLFPNLAVIRGETLFLNYALIIFEMMHIQEIGLHSLTTILHGDVYIEKNPRLCFVDTVAWEVITKTGNSPIITANKLENECPRCPNNHCYFKHRQHCWSHYTCQKVCPESCGTRACMPGGQCCHETCLGGCDGPEPEDCVVCNVTFQNKCVRTCPPDTYKYLNRRCVTADECQSMKVPSHERNFERSNEYVAFGGDCVADCPEGYIKTLEKPRKYYCAPCNGTCPKVCPGGNIDSIEAAKRLRGCTYIQGSLYIEIHGRKNVVKELEENLNMLEEIEGYLKIVRSFPLISLNFLRKLRVIHGKYLDSGKYSFVLLDNQNLRELWDWHTRKEDLRILNGRLFFHFNPKLCMYKIEKMKEVAQLKDFKDIEVSPFSNGDKIACNVTHLNAWVTKRSFAAVIIEWEPFKHYDPRTLLGYVLFYIEAPHQNVTLYDGRDACGGDRWMVDDISPTQNSAILTHLKPYTQYAWYIETYTIASVRTAAQSPLQYFRTLPSAPSPPLALEVITTVSNELTIKWQPPEYPNGHVTHYVITGTWMKDDQSMLDQRNFCSEPLIPDKKPVPTTQNEPVGKREEEEVDSCVCSDDDKGNKATKLEETEVTSQIHFEDSLHNLLFMKRPSSSRRKREASMSWQDTTSGELETITELYDRNLSTTTLRYVEGTTEQLVETTSQDSAVSSEVRDNFRRVVYGEIQIVVQNVAHFTEYVISVEACRESVPEDHGSTKNNCSRKSLKMGRTLPLEGADNVNSSQLVVRVVNNSLGVVDLMWEEPASPNGAIITYQIEYRSADHPEYSPIVECITRSQFLNNGSSYRLRGLQPGNYSLRVRAMSLAGYGDFTEPRFFYIKSKSSVGMEPLVGALVGTAVVAAVACLVVYLRRRYSKPNVKTLTLITTVNPEYTVYEPDEWEVPRKKVELLRELGQGSFGMVYEGIVRDVVSGHPEMRCAVKTVNEHATDRERSEFLNEASVMKAFNTHHILHLIGMVSQGQPVLVIMELMANGDLKSYLRSHRPDVSDEQKRQPPTLKRFLQMAVEIADGMAYLSAKKFVHRDLAARNCMVAEDLTVKIGDFGMTRDIYESDYYRKGTKGLLPVRWMAPESLKDGVFTSYSDVWSYGVVLWEMATLASQPYQGLSNDQVLRYVIDGGVMARPENCPDRLYQLMRLCWQHRPGDRPPFMEIVTFLLPDVSSDFEKVSFYHSEEGQELYTSLHIDITDDPSVPLTGPHHRENFCLTEGDDDNDWGQPPSYHSVFGLRGQDRVSPNRQTSTFC
ncbi:insulin-like peptide receptor isoform X2 [Periplaneta americana]|uniref:insulin-like peptide receptor isoform X2 n=1 Tax=Periplaneta americana TaxID=6978 RepID=UPI0037E81F58